MSEYNQIIYILLIKYIKNHISYNCDNPLISIFPNLIYGNSASILKYNGNKFINEKMKKTKKEKKN